MKSRERDRTPKYIQLALWNEAQYPIVDAFRCISVKIPDDDAYLPVLMALVDSAGRYWNYQNGHSARAVSPEARQKAMDIAALWEQAFFETDWEGCMDCCEDILAALSALQEQVTNVANDVSDVKQNQSSNAAQDAENSQSEDASAICGGAVAVVAAMHQMNLDNYANTESGLVDSVFELIPKFIAAIPIFGSLPFDELFELVNWYFEHQVEVYAAAFDDVKDGMAADLECLVQSNSNTFTFDVWAEWLNGLDFTYPGNAAAGLFARYAPTRQTFLNQIAALINKNASLQTYFDTLSTAWAGGLTQPETCAGDCTWSYQFNSATLPAFVEFVETPDGRWGHASGTDIVSDTRHVDLGGFKDIGGIAFDITLPSAKTITEIKIEQLSGTGVVGSSIVNRFFAYINEGEENVYDGDLPIQEGAWLVDDDTEVTGVKKISVQYLFYADPAVCAWNVTLYGLGVSPFPAV